MIVNKDKLSYLFIFFFSLLVSFFPLELIKGKKFVDREYYIDYLIYYSNTIDKAELNNIYDYIFNEWLWHQLIFFLKDDILLSPELIYNSISFLCFFVASIIIYNKTKSLFFVILLVNPIFVDFYHSQLRLAFAFSIWGVAYLLIDKYKRSAVLFSFLALFIHTASIFFVTYGFFADIITKKKINNYFKILILILLGFITSILTGPLRYTILSLFEDRRAEYADMTFDLISNSFWFYLLFALVLNFTLFKNRINNYQAYSIIFLSIVFLNYFTNGYSSRFVAATYPFLLISLSKMNSKLRIIGLSFYLFYTFILTYYWIG